MSCITVTPEKWSDLKCTSSGAGTMFSKLTVPSGIDWEQAAKSYANFIKDKYIAGRKVTSAVGRKDLTGAYIDITLEATDCVTRPENNTWTDVSCGGVDAGTSRMWAKLTIPDGTDWEAGAKAYATSIVGKTINGKAITSAIGRKDTNGAYVDAYYSDSTCVASPKKWDVGKCTGLNTATTSSTLDFKDGMDWGKGASAYAAFVVNAKVTVDGVERTVTKASNRVAGINTHIVDITYTNPTCLNDGLFAVCDTVTK